LSGAADVMVGVSGGHVEFRRYRAVAGMGDW
jgi:hypothetical protein